MQASDWKQAGRAARLGAICALGPSLIVFGWYVAKNRHLPLPWAQIGLISALVGTFTGAALGGVVKLLIARFERVTGIARLVANPITAGLVGGAVTSILAGIAAIAVFGSYRGPYVGTLEAASLLIAACFSLATVLTADARHGAGQGRIADLIPAAIRVVASAIAIGVVTVGITLLVLPSLFTTGMFWTARALISAYGPLVVGCVLGIAVGAIFGAHLGLSIWLGRRARAQ